MELIELPSEVSVHIGDLDTVSPEEMTDFPFQIINIVCLAKLVDPRGEIRINFDELEKRIEVKRLNRFPCVLFKIEKISIILFKNGKLILTGIKKKEEIPWLKTKITEILKIQGGLEFQDLLCEIQNLVVMSTLSKLINLELACLSLTNCLYEPEQFPAAIVKPPTGGTFLIFSNSKIIGLGLRSLDTVKKSLSTLISEIIQNDLFIHMEDDPDMLEGDLLDEDFFL